MKNIYKIGTVFIVLMIWACASDDNSATTEMLDFQVETLLRDVTNNHIITNVARFSNQVNILELEINNYVANPTESQLTAVRNQWKLAAQAYGKIYAFNIGQVRDQFMHQALYNWPITTTAVENFISDPVEITEAYVENLSPQAKTLSALEYLLFKTTDVATTNIEYINSENRRKYLEFTSKELKTQATRLVNIWSVSGDNYSTTFINNTNTGIQGSFNLLYNGLYNLIDTGKVTKIGKPAGLENSQNTNPELTQAYFSNTSLAILMKNIESVEEVYFNTQGLSIANYVSHVADNEILNTAVQTKINEVKTAINTIQIPLFDAITSNHDQVTTLYEKLNELGILFSVDVRSVLSITITSTDNDGD
ncbi:imelysin family protein [uncultured Kordia sp.]|uniref:imelysin family protein n=1 Tax=uncultured Kordia sp. TaxID=507699 RepID=UPI00261083B8|nr:imelysin family protein [uncultured Kordia sp.]